MSGIWDKFDDVYDSKKLANEISEAEKNGGFNNAEYEKPPYDTYIVKIEKLELGVTKENKPKLVAWFKIIEGQYKNKIVFMNQVLTETFLIHKAKEFLRSLDSGVEVTFESYAQFADLALDIHEAITADKLEYKLKFGIQKQFDTFEILEVYTAD